MNKRFFDALTDHSDINSLMLLFWDYIGYSINLCLAESRAQGNLGVKHLIDIFSQGRLNCINGNQPIAVVLDAIEHNREVAELFGETSYQAMLKTLREVKDGQWELDDKRAEHLIKNTPKLNDECSFEQYIEDLKNFYLAPPIK